MSFFSLLSDLVFDVEFYLLFGSLFHSQILHFLFLKTLNLLNSLLLSLDSKVLLFFLCFVKLFVSVFKLVVLFYLFKQNFFAHGFLLWIVIIQVEGISLLIALFPMLNASKSPFQVLVDLFNFKSQFLLTFTESLIFLYFVIFLKWQTRIVSLKVNLTVLHGHLFGLLLAFFH